MPHKMSFLVCSKRGLLYEIENCSLLFVWNSTVLMQDNEQLNFCLWGKMEKKIFNEWSVCICKNVMD